MNFQGYLGLLLIASPGGKEESAQQSSTGASAIGSVINHDRDTPAAPPSHSLFTLTHTSPSSPPFLALYLNERGEGSLKAVRRRTRDAGRRTRRSSLRLEWLAREQRENAEGHFHIHLAGVSSFLFCTAAL